MRSYPGHGMGMGSLFAGVIGFIGTLTFLALVALLVFFLVKRAKERRGGPGFGPRPGHQPGPHRGFGPPAMQLLDERLARGEIEVEDYLSRKAALFGEQPQQPPNEWTPTPPPGAEPTGPAPTSTDPTTRIGDDPSI